MEVKKIKKVELHLHLDGSIRPKTVAEIKKIDINQANKILKAKEKCEDLKEYLEKFSEPVSIMQTGENLEQIAYELCEDLIQDNVIYAEIRFAPNKHTQNLNLEDVVKSVLAGTSKSKIKTNLILCMMRGDSYEDNKKIIDLAKKYLNKGVGGIDLAGDEFTYKTLEFKELFEYANELKVPFTIHAGEADGIESINSAIEFGTLRIGHGIRCLENDECIEKIKKQNILLEICPTSNVQTNVVDEYKNHPIKILIEKGIKVCINTDNRTVSNITLSEEYQKLIDNFNFTKEMFNKLNINAIDSSFLNLKEKNELKNELKKEFE